MKRNIKRILLVLCMITCFFALSACQKSDENDEMEVDSQAAQYISTMVSEMLEDITAMSESEINEQIVYAERYKAFVYSEGYQSWLNVKKDTGDFQQILSTEVAAEDTGFSCVIRAGFSNRELEYKVFIDDEANVTSMSFNPDYTFREKMVKALMNTLMGVGTVFLVLIFIIFLISRFKYINAFEQKLRNKEQNTAVNAGPERAAMTKPVPAAIPEPENVTDNQELAAVITAAVAAAQGTPADGLIVRSIRRIPDAKWKNA